VNRARVGVGSGRFALAFLLAGAAPATAEWHFKPFVGFVFAGSTTLSDLDEAEEGARDRHLAVGGSVVLIGEVFGVEADLGWAPRFFERDAPAELVVRSDVTTLTGNVVVAMPRRMTQYTLRPYAVAGLGMAHASMEDLIDFDSFAETRAMFDVGGGVTGFLSERFGLSWDVRYFRSFGGEDVAFGPDPDAPQLAFWRANMSLTVRY
jgi:hypothetical protein